VDIERGISNCRHATNYFVISLMQSIQSPKLMSLRFLLNT